MQLSTFVALLSTVTLAMAGPPEIRGRNDKRIAYALDEIVDDLDGLNVGNVVKGVTKLSTVADELVMHSGAMAPRMHLGNFNGDLFVASSMNGTLSGNILDPIDAWIPADIVITCISAAKVFPALARDCGRLASQPNLTAWIN